MNARASRLVLGLCLGLLPGLRVASADLVLGSVAMNVPAAMLKRLTPLATYLAKATGVPVRLRLSPSLLGATQALRHGQTDIAYLTPVAYLIAHQNAGAVALVAPLTRGHRRFRLVIVTRCQGPYRRLAALRGHRFALGDPSAVLQRAVVVEAGLSLSSLRIFYLNHYDNIARGVAVGDFAGGILKDTLVANARAEGDCPIYRSPPMAGYLFAVGPQVPMAVRARLTRAFLALSRPSAAHHDVLAALDPEYTGFGAISDADYDSIRRMIRPWWHDIGLHPVTPPTAE